LDGKTRSMMQLAAFGLACIVVGAPLSHGAMIGLLGLPLTLVGGAMLAVAAANAGEASDVPRGASFVGMLLSVFAAVGVAVAAHLSTGLSSKQRLGELRPTATIYDVDAADLALAAVAWLVLPSLLTLGLALRTRWPAGRLARWWLLTFSAQPAAMACFLVLAWAGMPLSA
jgi:hypothetical protein